MAQLLIVEDDQITALALQRTLTGMGHAVVARVPSAAEAMAAVQAYRPDVVLLDIRLAGPQDGLQVGVDIQTFWSTPVIYLSGSDPAELGLQEFPEALWCYIAKPIDQVQLHDILAQLFPPHRGGDDPSHPLVRSRRVWTTPELREQMRHLRQPVGAFSRESGRNMTSTSLTSVWRGEWCFNDHARDTQAEAQSAAGAGNSPPRLAGAQSAGVPRGDLILPIKTLSLFSSTADLSSTKGAEPWTTPTPHQQRPRHKPP